MRPLQWQVIPAVMCSARHDGDSDCSGGCDYSSICGGNGSGGSGGGGCGNGGDSYSCCCDGGGAVAAVAAAAATGYNCSCSGCDNCCYCCGSGSGGGSENLAFVCDGGGQNLERKSLPPSEGRE